MIDHFRMFAAYNSWANQRIYAAAAALGDEDRRRQTGAAFGSLHGTLNHLLATDRIWMKRFTGEGEAPTTLDAILFEDFEDLTVARVAEDRRIAGWIDGLTAQELNGVFTYTPISIPEPISQLLSPCLAHLFNHQTHHRGQCHMILTSLRQPSVVLDLVFFLRSRKA
ncbi:diguanylate cyclase [Rhizobium sp. Leaf384]|uniref:DinB family protein n=1 Tax=unclassified Rhizobium TaxID=2613769 RepID=UPI000715B92B|nr:MULTISPECIES: DinB family protein [unclassified Rhizobium]KQS80487.1 diguanylate cyclase [Rhizobium sp. Leaf384]KQS86537.1 diguanylate cyclase [Rhizobium sp. Leaf383]